MIWWFCSYFIYLESQTTKNVSKDLIKSRQKLIIDRSCLWPGNFWLIAATTATTISASVFMQLFWEAEVCNFTFQLKSCQTNFSTFSPRFPWTILFGQSSSSMTSCIWELVSWRMTWLHHRKKLCINILTYVLTMYSTLTKTSTLSLRTSHYTPSANLTIHILVIMPHPTQCSLSSPATAFSEVSLQLLETNYIYNRKRVKSGHFTDNSRL